MFLFKNVYFSCSNGGCNWGPSPLYNIIHSVGAHARNNFTHALNYAHPYGYIIRAQFHFTLRKGALWRQWLGHGNCEPKALGSIPARVETYRRLRAIWPGVRSASSPTIPMAYSLYHGPSLYWVSWVQVC